MISDIIAKLAATSSSNEKRAILKENESNTTLRRLFELTYNNIGYKFGIRAPENIVTSGDGEITLDLLNDIVAHLDGRVVTGNAARSYLAAIFSSLSQAEAVVIGKMINRDMDCKVSVGLLNATWPGIVPEFPQMLASKFSDDKLRAPFEAASVRGGDEMIVQLKCDGGRAFAVVNHLGIVTLYSRAGNELKTDTKFDFLGKYPNMVFDGELLTINSKGRFNDRKTSNGIYTKTVRGTATKVETDSLHYVVWDSVPFDEYFGTKPASEKYSTRLDRLQTIVGELGRGESISIVPGKVISTLDEAQEFYITMLGHGEEGAMLKFLGDVWENSRSKRVLKMKEIKDTTLLCIGYTPHQKKEGWIGSLICVTSDGKLKTSVGSGLTDEDRQKPPETFVGKCIDLKYNQLIKSRDEGSLWSLFLPIFRSVRVDVTEADSLDKL